MADFSRINGGWFHRCSIKTEFKGVIPNANAVYVPRGESISEYMAKEFADNSRYWI